MMNMWSIMYMYAKVFGVEAARRALTPPEAWVRTVCAKTGADPEKAIAERNEAVNENVEFLESLIEHDFEDPDPAG